jgi:hypothetical protein
MALRETPNLLSKVISDALSASLVSTLQSPTSVYRMRGSKKTWTWGNQGCWIESNETGRVLYLLDQCENEESITIHLLEEYADWLKVFQNLCPDRQPEPKISYRNPMAVEAYLTRHPEVKDFIEVAWPNLVRFFGQAIDVVLEVLTYPEEAAHEELVGWVQWAGDVHEGLERLERFDDEWFLDHMAEVETKFNFNIETK